ncbi:hypothetical protein SUGI_0977030, partial [Cryptomeria japonica]
MEAPFDNLIIGPTAPAESSSRMTQLSYDVFINHHGGDVKDTVASSIYNKLYLTGLRVFLDKYELKFGIFFPAALKEAMRTSSVHIAIFSENYAQSPWCLAELAFILQLPDIIFIPIFYHVEPSDLRWTSGKGIYAEAFKNYEIKNRYTSEQLESWKWALHRASFFKGQIITKQGDEEAAVMEVVNRLLTELKKMRIDVAKHPVGLDEAEQDFNNKIIALQSAAGPMPIQMVGIWGMGGAGKTTLAKHLFNKKCLSIGRSSFLSDVREAAKNNRLLKKQKKLLKDLGFKDDLDNVDEGKQILRSRLGSVPVFIVLDDVDHTDQLDALLPPRESLGQGSLIIVTTRELRVLKAWGISAVYKIRALNATHAQQLFCWYAFGQPSPLLGFEDLSEMFIDACHGLPLSLKVLGGLLCGESDKNYWQSQFDKLSRIVPEDIKSTLRISYDTLDDEEKEMFLDVACFFIGWGSSRAIAVWDGSEWNGLHGWQRLVNKCLVELDEENLIRMHDHLRDLGREIANKRSPYRLWSKSQIIEIQPQQEAVRVRGMAYAFGENCNYHLGQGKVIIKTNQGERSLQPGSLGLKIFIGEGDFINEKYSKLAKELVCLGWSGFQHKSLPSWLSLKNLRILALSSSTKLEGLWKRDADVPSALKELVINDADNLKKIESLRGLRSLEQLEIRYSPRLDGLPSLAELTSLKKFVLFSCGELEMLEGLESLRSLETLEIDGCKLLNTLPNLGELTFLQKIELNNCKKLKRIESLKSLRSLEGLEICDCPELDGLPSLGELTSLKKFELIECHKLEKLKGLESLKSLETLKINNCKGLNTLPNLTELTSLKKIELRCYEKLKNIESIKSLRSLEELEICYCPELDGLPSLGELTSLKKFELTKCPKLEKLEGLESLKSLERLRIDGYTELNTLPSLAELTSLKEFDLTGCHKLEKMEGFGRLKSLETLRIDGCTELKTLPSLAELTSLKRFDLTGCHKLEKMEGFGRLKSLETLRIDGCTELKTLPSLAELTSLEQFDLTGCHKLEKMEGFGRLKSLGRLQIGGCTELNTLPSLAELTSLKQFDLTGCHKLEKMEGFGRLKSLERLGIGGCTELNTLPSLAELTSLKQFDLTGCHKLEKMEGFGRLKSLERLRIDGCTELNTLPGLAELTSLTEFVLTGCHKLEKMEGFGRLKSLETLRIDRCTELNTLPSLAELTSLKEFVLTGCHKLEKMEGFGRLKSLETLQIDGCTELNTLPSLAELTSLYKFELIGCHKLEKIEGLESLKSLETLQIDDCPIVKLTFLEDIKLDELEVHACLKAPLRVNLEQREGLKSLVVAANDIAVVEPFISKRQTPPRALIKCTRSVIDVGSLKNFFTSFPLKNVVESGSFGGLKFSRPETSENANAILICFIIDDVCPTLNFHIVTNGGTRSHTELTSGKWVWMGVFREGSDWLPSKRYEIRASSEEKDVKIKEGWVVMGEEGSIVRAFHRLSQ